MSPWQGVIDRYRRYLPVTERTPVVTLHEGNTPLLPAPRLAAATDPTLSIWLKCEGANPTGSFRDRGMTVAVSRALEAGSRGLICASAGSTAASAAAFAARAGLRAFVVVARGGLALGRLSQAAIHGARVLTIDGTPAQALAIVRDIAHAHPVTLVNAPDPFRLEGQKTAAFEVADQLGSRAPDYHLLPAASPDNAAACGRGYAEYHRAGVVKQRPRLVVVQAATAGEMGPEATEAADDSGGWVERVTDDELRRAYRLLAREEGVFAEPAAAITVAGLIKGVKAGRFEPGSTLVLTLTGHGLRDPDAALESASRPTSVRASVDAVLEQLAL